MRLALIDEPVLGRNLRVGGERKLSRARKTYHANVGEHRDVGVLRRAEKIRRGRGDAVWGLALYSSGFLAVRISEVSRCPARVWDSRTHQCSPLSAHERDRSRLGGEADQFRRATKTSKRTVDSVGGLVDSVDQTRRDQSHCPLIEQQPQLNAPNVIDAHDRREDEMVEVDVAKIGGHAEVEEDVHGLAC